MADFEIPENPEYKENIRKLETTDPAHADLFNTIFQVLLINQVFLKKMAERHIVDTDDKFSIYYQQLIDYVDKVINNLIGAAPETLDTIEEVAKAIQENKTVVDALNAAIGTKASKAEFDTHASNNTIHVTESERTKWDGKAEGIHTHNKVANTVVSMPIYNNTIGTIIDIAPEASNTMVCIRITGNSYNSAIPPIDCVYNFYDYSVSGIIQCSGIANGLPLDLTVFRNGGRCKAWVVQTSGFQTLQIEVTIGMTNGQSTAVTPIFTTGEMPTTGVTYKTIISPFASYHNGRKPTLTEIGAASASHTHSYLPLYSNEINMGGGNDPEKNILFYSSGGNYGGHQCKMYGGSSSSSTGLGWYDAGIGAGVLVYNDVDLKLTLGTGLNQIAIPGGLFGGIKISTSHIGYNPEGTSPTINFNSTNINFYTSSGSQMAFTSNNELRPSTADTGVINLGSSSGRWKQLFASTATISTSDKNLKEHISYIKEDDRYELLFDLLKPAIYKLKNTSKEDNHDRKHMGLYAQDVESSLEIAGIDISEFAVLCKDYVEIEEEYEVENEDGEIEKQTRIIETDKIIYSLRYEELIPLLISEVQELKAEIEELRNLVNIRRA